MRLGLKLWSTNRQYVSEAFRLYKEGIYNYIELFTVPGSFDAYSALWSNLKIPYVLHAPHSYAGLNFSIHQCFEKNLILCEEVDKYFRLLSPQFVIFHPGTSGTLTETLRQIKLAREEFPELMAVALIENKPLKGLNREICVGASPIEMTQILDKTGLGFCLDFGHASNYAASVGQRPTDVLQEFMKCNPAMFHLSDGTVGDEYDKHYHLGKGDFNLKAYLSLITNPAAPVTLETNKDSPDSLDDFKKDVAYSNRLFQ